jgi:UDP-N-acetylglucosamine 4,6-dehydratase
MLGSVLITGGTGYLGRRLVRRLLDGKLSDRVCVLSRGEHAQAEFRAEIDDDPRCRWLIGDVRSRDRLRRAFEGVDVVIHAAALKRVEVGQYNATEMSETIVDGTRNVIEAVQDTGVKKAVLISTDKALAPRNHYGACKMVAEGLFVHANQSVPAHKTRFAICRYGNVFQSRGSIVPKWKSEIDAGAKTIEVRNRECTRFFMYADQAVELVLDTITTMKGGEISVPDLPAYQLGDLADIFSETYGVAQKIVDLPDYEKVHEAMLPGKSSDLARRMTKDELRVALGLSQRRAAA